MKSALLHHGIPEYRSIPLDAFSDWTYYRKVSQSRKPDTLIRGYPAKRALSAMRKHGG